METIPPPYNQCTVHEMDPVVDSNRHLKTRMNPVFQLWGSLPLDRLKLNQDIDVNWEVPPFFAPRIAKVFLLNGLFVKEKQSTFVRPPLEHRGGRTLVFYRNETVQLFRWWRLCWKSTELIFSSHSAWETKFIDVKQPYFVLTKALISSSILHRESSKTA